MDPTSLALGGFGAYAGSGGYSRYGAYSGAGGFDGFHPGLGGSDYCERCDQPSDACCPRTGFCPSCQYDDDELLLDASVASGVCPGCLKRCPPCEYDEDEGCYECEM